MLHVHVGYYAANTFNLVIFSRGQYDEMRATMHEMSVNIN